MKLKIILFSILIVVLASLFASSYPDGLEMVAESLGFADKAQGSGSYSLIAAISGVLLIFGISFVLSKFNNNTNN